MFSDNTESLSLTTFSGRTALEMPFAKQVIYTKKEEENTVNITSEGIHR